MADLVDVTIPPEQVEGMESVVSRWLAEPGDPVTQHEPLLELTTDKVTVEIAAPVSGVLTEQLRGRDEPVKPGELVGRIDPAGVAARPAEPAETAKSAKPAQSAKSAKSAEPAKPARPAAVKPVVSSRPAPEPAPAARPRPVSLAPRAATGAGAPAAAPQRPGPRPPGAADARLSPAVRRAIRERGLDPGQIRGTGRGGRITYRDVIEGAPAPLDVAASLAAPVEIPMEAPVGNRAPHSPMRSMIARHMVESALRTAPHVTAVFEADLANVLAHRAALKPELERHGVRLTLTAYFVAATVHALQTVPETNSRWHDDGLELFDTCNIGIATALEQGGLIVPVLHGAEQLDLAALAARIGDLAARAREGSLTPAEVQHGTFTITNHGVSGSLIATPIINQPQSAILGIGKLQKRLVVVEQDGADAIQIRPMCYVTLTIDHRALDGFQANRFLSAFVDSLESSWLP